MMDEQEHEGSRVDSTSGSSQHIDAGHTEVVPSTVSDHQVSHTPLPWHVDGKFVRHHRTETVLRSPAVADCDLTHGLGNAGLEDSANAEYIVRACNSHHALVEALQFALPLLEASAEAAHLTDVESIGKDGLPCAKPPSVKYEDILVSKAREALKLAEAEPA